MNDIFIKKILNIFTYCILLIIPILRGFSFYLQYYNLISDYDSINIAYILYISIPFLLYTYVYNLFKEKKLNKLDFLFFLFIIVGILVCIFSTNKSISLFGKSYRHEGFLTLFTYFLLVVNWNRYGKEHDINRFVKFLTFLAIFNSVYSLFQIYTPFNFIIRYSLDTNMACGLYGNPNFFGSFIVTILGILTYKYLIQSENNLLILILLFISLINCQSTGPLLTYILVFVSYLIFDLKKLNIKRYFKLLIILIFVCIIVLCINKLVTYLFSNDTGTNKYKFKCEICEIKNNSKKIDNGRIEIWNNTLKIVKKHPIIGIGYDNLYLIYPNNAKNTVEFSITNNVVNKNDLRENIIIDNAHNIYLNMLVSSGIIGFIPFIILLTLTYFKGLKQKNKILFYAFIAYSIQGFANINMLTVAPIYFVIIGLILSRDKCQD